MRMIGFFLLPYLITLAQVTFAEPIVILEYRGQGFQNSREHYGVSVR